ncbi:hypothetical protein C0J52_10622 [Blattella germanica]|nr:hypothetical protein C0J52_10622 [Blattella germanica]
MEVSKKICEKSHEWIHFPSNTNEVETAKREWQEQLDFPCAISALDCISIEIKEPKLQSDESISKKGKSLIYIQASCNIKECFTSVDIVWKNSEQDSEFLVRSGLTETIAPFRGKAVLVGDSRFGIAPWLMTPYDNPSNHVQKNYNRIHCRNRVIIKKLFGQLKRRFPILSRRLNVDLDMIVQIVMACFVLHNVAKFLKDRDFEGEDEEETDELVFEDILEEDVNQIRVAGRKKRDELASWCTSISHWT